MVPTRILGFLAVLTVPSFAFPFSEEEREDVGDEIGNPLFFFPVNLSNKKSTFVCPAAYGRYPHETDCALYYECRFAYPHLMKCSRGKLYDERKEQCNDARRVTCKRQDRDRDQKDRDRERDQKDKERDQKDRDRDRERDQKDKERDQKDKERDQKDRDRDRERDQKDRERDCKNNRDRDCKKDKDGDHDHHHKKDKEIDDDEETFKCPYIWGTFAHAKDCSKYYVCMYKVPALFQCYGTQLYDTRSRKCQDRRRVRCEDRLDRDQMRTSRRPTTKRYTTPIQPEETTVPSVFTTTENPHKFHCPFPYGRYADPHDCSRFYECRSSVAKWQTCPNSTLYDERREECLQDVYVRCGDRPGGLDGDKEDEKEEKEPLRCPYTWGTFPHPDDCSKYIICIYDVPTSFNCKKDELFHAYYRRCYPKEQVTCDYRINPDDLDPPVRLSTTTTLRPTSTQSTTLSTFPSTTTTTRPSPSPSSTTIRPSPSPSTTTRPSTFPPSTTESSSTPPSTITTTTPRPSTPPSTTTTPRPSTPPSTTTTPSPSPLTTTTSSPATPPTTTTRRPSTTPPTTTTPNPSTLPSTTTTLRPSTPPPTTTTRRPSTPSPTTVTPSPSAHPSTTTTTTPVSIPPSTREISTSSNKFSTTIHQESTTQTTNVPKPNTPPPTDCEDDDLDCIIDTSGDVKGWFDCPERFGHFAHGGSHQLFIHCDNWRPFIKKCADGTVFSPKYLVCMWLEQPH